MDYEGKKFLNIFKSVFQESISVLIVLIVCESRSGDDDGGDGGVRHRRHAGGNVP